ncbi:O-linked N-acetylglucosamine transferase, SPINDLY family protein [Thiorhodovibrio frisius]|uniref:protein O-GlcNAc transferase n=1 Tax=Thiorhodovibrio frisius TaxID=631362 RepID=H8YYA5_9GAMM|nr:tetratricopeptide repeat protein [Thiorhodovibrio frisius]EIC23431.1 hypothetical protein Thi970DRAFT_01096 [Thiorhodovibrio frisius]WPL23488.1 putative O-linked N-acetylglucosamine transferase, SPINDLY family [Thiorhodovibrio frisius]
MTVNPASFARETQPKALDPVADALSFLLSAGQLSSGSMSPRVLSVLDQLRGQASSVAGARGVVTGLLSLTGKEGSATPREILATLAQAGDGSANQQGRVSSAPNTPSAAVLWGHFGLALFDEDRLDDAIWALRQSLDCQTEDARIWRVLGNALRLRGEIDEAISVYQALLSRRPDQATHRRLLLAMNSSASLSPEEVAEEHRRWADLYAAPAENAAANPRAANPDKSPLTVGYVSPDFRSHPVAYFFLPVVEGHRRDHVRVVAYATTKASDSVRRRIRAAADQWREVAGWSRDRLLRQIRADGVDILVDLAGHFTGNRLDVFACRAAPVQVTYLGYPNTTGLRAMDYRLVDPVSDPPGRADALATEELIRLAPGFLAFEPPSDAPAVAESPAVARGYITFGSFNRIAKLSPPTIETWAALLESVANARLLLKSNGLTTEGSRERLRMAFSNAGLHDLSRLDLRNYVPSRRAHLALYGELDIALDPFPYNGTTTTCQALWMGVPVVALEGAAHVSRMGMSLLQQVGLSAHIAKDREAYVRIAANLASQVEQLNALRHCLRPMMASSPLLDHVGFVRQLEHAYRTLWRRACGSRS